MFREEIAEYEDIIDVLNETISEAEKGPRIDLSDVVQQAKQAGNMVAAIADEEDQGMTNRSM